MADNRANSEAIKQQVEEIIAAGALGKSDAFPRLLRFLADRVSTQKSVKEIEIAIEVFGRDVSFDGTQDSLVRVYIHKLRTKLDNFYEKTETEFPQRLQIPKGSYLLCLEDNTANLSVASTFGKLVSRQQFAIVAISLIVGICLALATQYFGERIESETKAFNSAIWAPLAAAERPILVVLGDVFIFSEVTEEFEQLREIRDFSISNMEEFEQRSEFDFNFMQNHRDYGVRYLPGAIAPAMRSLGNFIEPDRAWQVVLSSELSSELEIEDLSGFDIIYLGYYTGLQQLSSPVFSNSSLQLHPNGNLLSEINTGEIFVGEGQLAAGYSDRYVDYGLFRKARLENGSTLFALMSARDTGLTELARFVFSDEGTTAMQAQIEQTNAPFEMLLEVSGNDPEKIISQIRLIQQAEL